jgi:hypothetical protein
MSGFPSGNSRPGRAYFRDTPGRFAFDAAGSLGNSRDADFDAEEEVTAAYLEDIDLGGGVFQESLSSGDPQAKPFESM